MRRMEKKMETTVLFTTVGNVDLKALNQVRQYNFRLFVTYCTPQEDVILLTIIRDSAIPQKIVRKSLLGSGELSKWDNHRIDRASYMALRGYTYTCCVPGILQVEPEQLQP